MLAFGAISVALSVWLAQRMPVVDRQSHPLHMLLDIPKFWFQLSYKILISNIDVSARILGFKKITPQLIELDCSQYTDLQKVIYANAITLTPGSASLHLEDGKLWVHCISKEGADELLSGDMQSLVPTDNPPKEKQ